MIAKALESWYYCLIILKGKLSMTESEKKAIYDKGYAHWLKYYKNEFKEYCSCSKLPVQLSRKSLSTLRQSLES